MTAAYDLAAVEAALGDWSEADLRKLIDGASDDPATELAKIELLRRGQLLRVADVEPVEVRWLWRDFLPLQYIAILDGDTGRGKSTLLLDIVARMTTGRAMPDASASDLQAPATALIVNGEDVIGATTRPRLEAAGADLERVFIAQGIRDESGSLRLFSLPTDARWLEEQALAIGAKLIVIDPLSGHLASGVDMHKDSSVRQAMAPLATIAERCDCSIVCVRHLSKGGDSRAVHRGLGSVGISASARVALIVADDPDDQAGERRVLAVAKSNVGRMPQSLSFKLVEAGSVAKVEWLGRSRFSANEALAAALDSEGRSALDEAVEFLQSVLADGPAPTREVNREAGELGISHRTLKRARETLGVEAIRESVGGSGTGRWVLQLTKGASAGHGTLASSNVSVSPSISAKPKGANARGPNTLGPLGGPSQLCIICESRPAEPGSKFCRECGNEQPL